MGTHRDPLTLREWLRYRRYLAARRRDWHKAGKRLTPDTFALMRAEARRAAKESR